MKNELQKALAELRKGKKRKFEQTIDLIVNLQKFDIKKTPLNLFFEIPNKIKDKKICAFLEVENKNVTTITQTNFKKYSDKKELKKLVKNFDFFIAQASLMPKVATVFGRVLGPAGKMPSPQLGILMNPDDKSINEIIQKVNKSVKIRPKEPCLKIPIGKENMKDEDIIENIISIYGFILKNLTKGKDNVKNIQLKFTMTKPVKINEK